MVEPEVTFLMNIVLKKKVWWFTAEPVDFVVNEGGTNAEYFEEEY